MATTRDSEETKKTAAKSRTAASRSAGSKTSASKSSSSKSSGAKGAAAKSAGSRTSASKSAPKKAASASKAAPRRAAAKPKGGESVKNFQGKTVQVPLAFAVLMRQHREVDDLVKAFEKARTDEEKGQLAHRICMALTVHAQIEEELLYPEAHERLADEDLVDEALVEHQSAKWLIQQIQSMQPDEHMFDAKVKVLGEYVKHHVQEEEQELFPQIQKSGMDLQAIGERLQARADQLMAEMEREPRSGGIMSRLRESFGPRP